MMILKTPIKMLAAAVLTTGLFACTDESGLQKPSAPKEASAPVAASAVQAQSDANLPVYKIRTANQPYPPFNIYHGDHISGLEPEILAAIAKDQGFRIEHVPYVWDVIFTDLDKNGIAMVGGGLAADDMDLNVLTTSKAYLRAPDCVVAASDAQLKDWNKKKIALVEDDEADEDLIKHFGVSPDNIVHVKSQYQALQFVRDGQVNATMSDCYVLKYYMKQSLNDTKFVTEELKTTAEDSSYDLVLGVRKDETELVNKINAGIDNIKKNGELDKILQKWR